MKIELIKKNLYNNKLFNESNVKKTSSLKWTWFTSN